MRRSEKKRIISVEDVLIRLIVVCITVLLLSQLLLLKEGTRRYLSKVDKMEGEDLSLAAPLYADTPMQITEEKTVVRNYQNLLRSSKVIMIKMISATNNPSIFIMINGKKIDDFSKGDRKITVYDGDYLEIDATAVSLPVQFIIKVPDKEFLSPQDGLVVEGSKKILVVGKIKFKNE
ncbi:MAG: DUF5359 family protein [Sporomusaceae bacterium]|nr:DUF5359 family protein [Sporomusaceae bacterium]